MHKHDNFYRLLHVQHDAPTVVIKASYRAMMQKLRYHPDLGGDEGNAKLLNEAMATLENPTTRAAYDDKLFAGESSGNRELNTPAPVDVRRTDAPDFGTAHCRFCRASRLNAWTPAAGYAISPECSRCGAPTRPVERIVAGASSDKRQLERLAHARTATIWREWPLAEPIGVTLSDITVTGCGLEADFEPRTGQVLLINAATLNAIAEVRRCRPTADTKRYRIGLAFVTLQPLASPGDLFSAVA